MYHNVPVDRPFASYLLCKKTLLLIYSLNVGTNNNNKTVHYKKDATDNYPEPLNLRISATFMPTLPSIDSSLTD